MIKPICLIITIFFAQLCLSSCNPNLTNTTTSNINTKQITFQKFSSGQKLILEFKGKITTNQSLRTVVLVHGGAFASGTIDEMKAWSNYLSNQGFQVFNISYRLPITKFTLNKSNKLYRDVLVNKKYWNYKMEIGDIKCALTWINKQATNYAVDTNHISLFGVSAGATLALLAAYSSNNPKLPSSCGGEIPKIKSVIDFYGPTDMMQGWRYAYQTAKTSKNYLNLLNLLTAYLNTPKQNPLGYKLATPLNYINSHTPPTLIIHGISDNIVPVSSSLKLTELLLKNNITHTSFYFKNSNHVFDIVKSNKYSTRLSHNGKIAAKYVINFLKNYG